MTIGLPDGSSLALEGVMDEEYVSQDDCECDCHSTSGVEHEIACCDGVPVDFWSVYEDVIEQSRTLSSRPRGKSPHDEPVDEWLCYVVDKRTGKPIRGPGSDSIV